MSATEPASGFKKYFSLEEAADRLPEVQDMLSRAHAQMNELRDAAILHKRILMAKQDGGKSPTDAEVALLQQKCEAIEEAFSRWVFAFAEQGIILRDLETGLIDFPYHSKKTGQDYFLCWRLNEDGIFYFHGINEGFSGRHPIALLPE